MCFGVTFVRVFILVNNPIKAFYTKMIIKLSVILTILTLSSAQDVKLDWDLAVVVDNQIRLLSSNGTLIDFKDQPFSSLKALAYDNIRDQFIVSDMHKNNDTVYTIQFDKHITVPIVQGLPGDVQGLAVDPIEDMLYWTDEVNQTIHRVSLRDSNGESKEFFVLNDKRPHALAIDICQRYLYFTNPTVSKPSIERVRLNGSDHEVVVDNLLMTPEGITIDYKAQKLYWADSRVGTAGGRIESVDLDGKNRQIVVERNTMQPFGLAVDEEAIYWTDTNNNGLYKFFKGQSPYSKPITLAMFDRMPMGLVSYDNIIKEMPDCKQLEAAIKEYKEEEWKEDFDTPRFSESENFVKDCLNAGELRENRCLCPRGFTGTRCEVSVCQNLCLNGDCYMSSIGKAVCRCDKGFMGDRCEKNKCDDYCLNGGECSIHSYKESPRCQCSEGFIGSRCEYSIEVCDMYCIDRKQEDIVIEKYEELCRCGQGFNSRGNHTSAALSVSPDRGEVPSVFKEPVIYLAAMVIVCIMIIVALGIFICTNQKKRPRIKKRIIVNKNVTPLTYRPQQPTTEQCEITIENCCNMNICETPCFEPREDKKKLLKNMEAEDLY